MLKIFNYDYGFSYHNGKEAGIISLYFKPEHLDAKVDKELNKLFSNFKFQLKPFKNNYKYVLEFVCDNPEEKCKELLSIIDNDNILLINVVSDNKLNSAWAMAWIKYLKM